MFIMLPLSSRAIVSLTPNRVSISALQSHLLPLRASSYGCSSSRNPGLVLHQDISSLVTRRATSCASSSKCLTVCLLGIVFGRKAAYSSIVFGRGAVGCAENILKKKKHLVNGSLRTTSSHTFNKPRNRWKHRNTNITVNNNRRKSEKKTLQKNQNPRSCLCLKCLLFFKYVSNVALT